MRVLKSISEIKKALPTPLSGKVMGLVPTMGCLHAGHLELVKKAKEKADVVIVSIFVNPLQFGPQEDLEKYPRTFEEDKNKLEALGVDFLFHPEAKELYPDGFSTTVSVGSLGSRLCGQYRPGHFEGVATVCLKLFQITQAHFAIFGEKDYQQLQVIKKMVSDLNLGIEIVAHPTVREKDGLAMSSRNRYLNSDERNHAGHIPVAFQEVQQLIKSQPDISVNSLLSAVRKRLAPLSLQYAEVTQGEQLQLAQPLASVRTLKGPRLFLAAFSGTTRLIDNLSLEGVPS